MKKSLTILFIFITAFAFKGQVRTGLATGARADDPNAGYRGAIRLLWG